MPGRLEQDLQVAQRKMRANMGPERFSDLEARLVKRVRRRDRIRQAAALTAIFLLATGGFLLRSRLPMHRDIPLTTLADGSTIQKELPSTVWTTIENTPRRTRIQLTHGKARFRVTHNPERQFIVETRFVRVEVLGTIFRVRAADTGPVTVKVEEGSVRVYSPKGHVVLSAGDEREFSDNPPAVVAPPATTDAPVPQDPVELPTKRILGKKRVGAATAPGETTSPAQLMAAADEARLQGHSRQAIGLLQQVVTKFSESSEAPFAAFSLGRIYKEELKEFSKAAVAFAKVRDLQPHPELAEDALAHEIECLWKSGARDVAKEKWAMYARSYPKGRRFESLRRLLYVVETP